MKWRVSILVVHVPVALFVQGVVLEYTATHARIHAQSSVHMSCTRLHSLYAHSHATLDLFRLLTDADLRPYKVHAGELRLCSK